MNEWITTGEYITPAGAIGIRRDRSGTDDEYLVLWRDSDEATQEAADLLCDELNELDMLRANIGVRGDVPSRPGSAANGGES